MNDRMPHPLLLSPVIHSVMEFLSIRDLINSRLVCTNWNTAACSVLRKTKTLKFRMQPEHLQDYINTMKESNDFPYSHYELEFYHMNETIVQNFLQICGKSIICLQLNNCRCTSDRLLEILNALKNNLKCFSLNCDAIIDYNDEIIKIQQPSSLLSQNNIDSSDNNQTDNCISNTSSPIIPSSIVSLNNNNNLKSLSLIGEFSKNKQLIYNLLKSSSKLESIEFRCCDNLSEYSTFETMCYEVFIQNNIKIENLTSFQMKSKLNNNQIINLYKKNLKNLNCLHINLDISVKIEPLLTLLIGVSKNLKKLDLGFSFEKNEKKEKKRKINDDDDDDDDNDNDNDDNGNSGNDDIDTDEDDDILKLLSKPRQYILPAMNNLLRLTLSNFKGSLAFINDCEKLMYLVLVNCDVTIVTLAHVRKHHLKSLVSTTFLDCNVCIKLAQVFPDLKELNVELDDIVLRTLFQIMPNLEELIISGDKITDDSITGIDNIYELITTTTMCNHMEDLESEFQVILNYDDGLDMYRKYPSIANLTKLRKITIQNAGFISDASVLHGLILCNNLNEISLFNSKVTDCSLHAIADNLPQLKKLEALSHFPSVTSKGKSYIRTKLTGCDFILGQKDIICMYRHRQVRTC